MQVTAVGVLILASSVGDILKIKGQDVIAIDVLASITESARLMSHKRIGLLVVLNEEKKFVGVLSERDIVRAVATDVQNLSNKKVGDYLTRKVIACDPQADPSDVISVMKEKGFRHMPVVENGSVKGVVSRTDLAQHLGA